MRAEWSQQDTTIRARLTGRITAAYTCSFNCFALCAKIAEVCETSAANLYRSDVTGTSDEYFGKKNTSMATWVASADGGYGGSLTRKLSCHDTILKTASLFDGCSTLNLTMLEDTGFEVCSPRGMSPRRIRTKVPNQR